MPNHGQFVLQTAAVLMAFGLIASVQVALSAADPIEVHVAPAGDDAANGSRAKPGKKYWCGDASQSVRTIVIRRR